MHHLTVSGHDGVIKWGYLQAMTFTRWRLEAGILTATVETVDTFRLEQTPLRVEVPVGSSRWRWPVTGLTQQGSTVSVTVGPQLE